ncbi:hypothetical protein PAPHI01_2279 [Pancytospora philotis]|nr:hypothetical protein PAPHI01_2279 [Pancytospora philotis]
MRRPKQIAKPFSYYDLIRMAIRTFPGEKATCSMIFQYMAGSFPKIFKYSNSNTWKNNIRQTLSKNPEFVKYRNELRGVQHYWTYVSPELIEAEEDIVYYGRAYGEKNSMQALQANSSREPWESTPGPAEWGKDRRVHNNHGNAVLRSRDTNRGSQERRKGHGTGRRHQGMGRAFYNEQQDQELKESESE